MIKNLLDDIVDDIPAIERALKLQKKAASVGFDWKNSKDIIKKIEEELVEIQDALNKTYKAEIEIKSNANIRKDLIIKNLIIDLCSTANAS